MTFVHKMAKLNQRQYVCMTQTEAERTVPMIVYKADMFIGAEYFRNWVTA